MKFGDILCLVGDQPVFESSLLLAGSVEPAYLQRQLSGWVAGGKLIRLRRGLYMLSATYRRFDPHPFLLANRIRRGSYVSLQSALEHWGTIPEYVPVVTSVWTGSPGEAVTPIGGFLYRHLRTGLLFGYGPCEVAPGQEALVAEPEKALLDLVHLTPGGDDPCYLRELRLQDLTVLSGEKIRGLAARSERPKLLRAADLISGWIREGGVPG